MKYIVMSLAEGQTRPVVTGPFSSFAQALDWIGMPEAKAQPRIESDGQLFGNTMYTVRAMYKP